MNLEELNKLFETIFPIKPTNVGEFGQLDSHLVQNCFEVHDSSFGKLMLQPKNNSADMDRLYSVQDGKYRIVECSFILQGKSLVDNFLMRFWNHSNEMKEIGFRTTGYEKYRCNDMMVFKSLEYSIFLPKVVFYVSDCPDQRFCDMDGFEVGSPMEALKKYAGMDYEKFMKLNQATRDWILKKEF